MGNSYYLSLSLFSDYVLFCTTQMKNHIIEYYYIIFQNEAFITFFLYETKWSQSINNLICYDLSIHITANLKISKNKVTNHVLHFRRQCCKILFFFTSSHGFNSFWTSKLTREPIQTGRHGRYSKSILRFKYHSKRMVIFLCVI